MNNSQCSSDEDTCSTISFRNEDNIADFILIEDNPKQNEDIEGGLVKIDTYSSSDEKSDSHQLIEEEDWSDKECRYLAQMNDPRYMTARQRSLLDKRSGATTTEDLSFEYQFPINKEPRTPRQISKTGDHRRAVKERQQEEQRVTVERLLKVTPGNRSTKRTRPTTSQESDISKIGPTIRFVSTQRPGCASYVAFSDPSLCPNWESRNIEPSPPVMCSLPGCPNRKLYRCAKTGASLCSLQCYKANLVATT